MAVEGGGYSSNWAFGMPSCFLQCPTQRVLPGYPLSTAEGQYGEVLSRDTPIREGRASPGERSGGEWPMDWIVCSCLGEVTVLRPAFSDSRQLFSWMKGVVDVLSYGLQVQ